MSPAIISSIVCFGSPFNGMTFYGPFEDSALALKWAEDENSESFEIIDLHPSLHEKSSVWNPIENDLPELLECELGDWCRESRIVLIRSKDKAVHLAWLRQEIDNSISPAELGTFCWVLDGRDGYIIATDQIEAWTEIPT